MPETSAYGHWGLVLINVLVFFAFGASFLRTPTGRDWRSLGPFSAFLVALFTEMYGFPLTIYLLSGWLVRTFPGVDFWSHDGGHLLETTAGLSSDPHIGPFHVVSYVLIAIGFILLARAWSVLFAAQRRHELAKTGPYAWIRHPQYVGFIVIMTGFLLQWPTLPTLIMFPILIWIYVRLAHREEAMAEAVFEAEWLVYANQIPAFLPSLDRWRKEPG